MAITLRRDLRLLFIGDSITDCGQQGCPERMGSGYPRLVRDWLLAKAPDKAPTVINRGISGNKVTDLADRWDKDVLAERPDVVSIMIGINDVWHGLMNWGAGGVPIDEYGKVYRTIIQQLKTANPRCQLVLCEPSVIWPPGPEQGNAALAPYVQEVHKLAKEVGAECVAPLHTAFVDAKKARPDIEWAPDGVHPSTAGHMLIARTWLNATGLV